MQIARGQRVKLADLGLADKAFSIQLALNTGGMTVDVACFGLDASKKLSDERYMTFFNQPASPCGAVKLAGSGQFEFDLARLPASIDSLTITLAIDGAGQMNQLGACVANLIANGTEAARYAFDGSHFAAERAVMLLELYRKDGAWRLCAVGQGFNGGLDALVQHFGGAVAAAPAPQVAPAPAPEAPKVSLSKITLEKRGDKISLEKRGAAGHGRIVCNLNWSRTPQKTGFFGSQSKGIDLDLGCLFEMMDGRKSCVQALGNTFGAYEVEPYIHMAGDDRTGDVKEGEFLFINGDHLQELRRICVYAFIYEGVANWAQANGVVTITVPGHPPVEVRLDQHDKNKGMCAVAMLENDGGSLKVTKLAEYFSGHEDLDRRYSWGLRWQAGHK
ncbi:TerD family protein [Uliginosibacterium gangwonense]|uniref:TerD family protein n=1 Tax=Uliginosibacterium gangwonense TaxID=392736 RepID=UPI000364A06D|nr:TerD family protein [Uliginosibacterium gangwonense]